MGWTPLPADVPLDHEALPPPPNMAGDPDAALHAAVAGKYAPADVANAPAGFVPLPDNAQVDEAAPEGTGFTDEQKQAIQAYIPKAKDAADLEKFSLEVSGGKSKIGNAQEVIDKRDKGATTFGWAAPTIDKAMGQAKVDPSLQNPLTLDHIRQAVGDALLNVITPGLGVQSGAAAADNGEKALIEHVANAAAADYGPEVGGVIDSILNGGDIEHNVAHERAQLMGDSEGHPVASALGELGGVALTAPLGGAVADAADLGKAGRVVQQAAEGAAYGSGAAGPGERAPGAIAGAVLAPVAGVVTKGVLAAPAAIKSGAKTVLEGSPGLARRIIAKAIADDANTPETVAKGIAAAHANAVPMALADTGENARGLLAAASRSSGAARTVARDALEERQSGLADRVTGAIQRDLGPVANPHQIADSLLTKATTEAAPLYEATYAKPGVGNFVKAIQPLLERPSMKKAAQYAYRVAQEEGVDPETLGLQLDTTRLSPILGADGQPMQFPEVTFANVPTWKTLDYIKRGLDQTLEGYRNPVTDKLDLDTMGHQVENTRKAFLKAFDTANPTYAQARAAYGGPMSGIQAMNAGRKALSLSADDLEARMRDMTPFEKQMYALGARRAMAETVASKGDTADVVNALVGTGKKRAMLARLFGDRKSFQRFVDTLGQEREGWRTFKQGLLGSPTAANISDDAALNTATLAADLMTTGLPVATATRNAVKFLGVKVGQKAQQHIAALLSNTDPAAIRELAAELRAKAQKRGINVPTLRMLSKGAGNSAAVLLPGAEAQ